MILTVATESDLVVSVECVPGDTVGAIKEKVTAQTGIPQTQQLLSFHNKVLSDRETLASLGIADGDLLMLQQNVVQGRPAESGVFGNLSRQEFIDRTRRNPQLMAQLDAANPDLAAAIRRNDGDQVEALVSKAREHEIETRAEMQKLMLNPMDIESQRKIEELIQRKNIEENLMQAIEHIPEMFATTTMLHVNMEVNGVPVQAFVDTGAQMTIMSFEFAEKCSLARLIDRKFAGTAVGVGQGRILGRVHQAPLKVSNEYVASSLTVLEQKSGPPFIFGLDNLIRHQCVVDLKNMKLTFGSIGLEVPFLAEHEIQRGPAQLAASGGQGTSSNSEAAAQNSAPGDVPEEKVNRLMALGFDRQRCIDALRATNGNEDAAAGILLGYN